MSDQDPLFTLAGVKVYQDPEPANRLHWTADMDVDCDGHPHSYRFDDSYKKGAMDSIRKSAGYPDSEWWNVLVRDPNNPSRPLVDEEGFCISMTSYQREEFGALDRRRYLDPGTIPYIVAPGRARRMCRGILCGCRGRVTDIVTNKKIEGVCGDFSGGNIGEAGVMVAQFFDPALSPRNGDDRARYLYEFWPGTLPTFDDPVTGKPFRLIRA